MEEVKRGEIYDANLSGAIGSEQKGNRPVLCIQNDVGNACSNTVIVAVISRCRAKPHLPTQVKLKKEYLDENSVVKLEQIRTIDKTRLIRCLGQLDDESMKQIDTAIAVSLGMAHSEVKQNG